MSGSGADAPRDSLRERAGGSTAKLWLLLEADRWLVTGLLVAVVFGTLLALGVLLPGVAETVRSGDPIETLFQGLLTATITGVTLVLTLNQLVLSQELGAVGDQRERMAGAMRFRDDVAEAVGAPVGPARPAQFLRALVQVAGSRAETLRAAVGGPGDSGEDREDGADEAARAVADLTDSLVDNADRVAAGLDGARFGEFDVLSSALDFNYSWKVYAARRIRERHGEALGVEGREALAALIETLRLFGPAREHFKTLYFQWELIDLSRRILASAVPALLVSVAMILYVDAGAISGTALGVDAVVVLAAAAVTVAVAPFLLLLAYVLRIATVTKRTLSIGPFILRETDADEVEWD
jgi:hypothetical protein